MFRLVSKRVFQNCPGATGCPSLSDFLIILVEGWQSLRNIELRSICAGKYYHDDQVKQEEMCRMCDTHRPYDKFVLNYCR
jgi:hypothetical protein